MPALQHHGAVDEAWPPRVSFAHADELGGVTVQLLDGTPIQVRPIEPGDGDRLVEFHDHLSSESVYLRFFSPHPHLSGTEVDRFTHVDGSDRMALVATSDDDLIGVARYDRDPNLRSQAEVAFVVADAWQGKGVGTVLLARLAQYARSEGIQLFTAQTLAFNGRMQSVFRHSGFDERCNLDSGVLQVQLDIGGAPR